MQDDDTRIPGASRGSEDQLVGAAWAQFQKFSSASGRSRGNQRCVFQAPGYRILGEIHRGGQGVVYQALQESTRRKVAIKVLKEGPFADRVELARFEREVDVLSRLNHRHVVAIHDRGLAAGHAYYVMDYIAGKALDAHVSSSALSIRETLDLFARVCEAVNVAHLRGVIHRDLKPGNIRIDESGEPRILDFGLAKIGQQAAGGSSSHGMTMTGQFVGSLPWASPEQAEGRSDEIDVRTDVYSLGVILYQLLTSRFPYPVTGRVQDVVRHIVESGPARFESAGRDIDHDVELIVLKCLAKEADLRYQSAGELARDIRHFLANEPIQATPPSAVYKLRKFARRHRALVLSGVAVSITLVVASVVSIGFAVSEARQRAAAELALGRAEQAERAAQLRADELAKVAGFQQAQLADIDPQTMGVLIRARLIEGARSAAALAGMPPDRAGAEMEDLERRLAGSDFTGIARDVLHEDFFGPALAAIEKQFAEQPIVKASLLQSVASTLVEVGMYDLASGPQAEALAIRRRELGNSAADTLASIDESGMLLKYQGRLDDALVLLHEAHDGRRETLGDDSPATLESLDHMGSVLQDQGRLADSEVCYRQALDKRRRVLGHDHLRTLTSMNNLGALLRDMGRLDEAEALWREVLERRRRVLGDDDPKTLVSINNMSVLLQSRGRFAEAEVLAREALERSRAVLGVEHPFSVTCLNRLGGVLILVGRLAEAEPVCREAFDQRRRIFGDDHPATLVSLNNLAAVLREEGRLGEAEPLCREALERYQQVLGRDHQNTLTAINNLGIVLQGLGKFEEAEPLFREAVNRCRDRLGDDHPDTLNSINNLGGLLIDEGRLDEGEPLVREALDGRRRILGNDNPETFSSLKNMGVLLEKQGRLPEAEVYLREAVDRSRQVLGDEHPTVIALTTNLCRFLEESHKVGEALDLLRLVEPVARKRYQADDPQLGRFLTILGRVHARKGEFDAALANLTEADEILSPANEGTAPDRKDLTRAFVELYESWNKASPGQGYDARAAEWQAWLNEGAAKPD